MAGVGPGAVSDQAKQAAAAAGDERAALTEDERVAATLKVGISNYVGAAALAVLGGAAGLFTYISQNYNLTSWFYAVMVVSAVCLVGSIAIGGDGADVVVHQVARGKWRNAKTWQFNWQATLTLIGLVLVLVATAVGVRSTRAQARAATEAVKLEQQIIRLQRSVARLERSEETGARPPSS